VAKIEYEKWRPSEDARIEIARAEAICRDYAAQGYDLTLRQLYYRFVAAGWIPNNMKSYKRLGEIVSRARLAGLLDWNYIVDRTRALRGTSHWETPGSVINSAAYGYRRDKWATSPRRVEVWVEKDALVGVIGRVAERHDVNFFSCRGYVSSSEQWAAARRILGYLQAGQAVTVLHLGDHDPSGIDMTRDITDRLTNFILTDWCDREGHDREDYTDGELWKLVGDSLNEWTDEPFVIDRIALNANQVRQYNPPPNPAKLTDSRANGYIARHGNDSWELDALPPEVLDALIDSNIAALRDGDAYNAIEAEETRERELLTAAARRWPELVGVLDSDD
jgi:hypothetical protein